MYLPRRDVIATALVVAAVLLYLLWALDVALPSMSGTRAIGLAVLALGFAASASAVVPSFDKLLHGNKAYLVATSLLGLVARLHQCRAPGQQMRPGTAVPPPIVPPAPAARRPAMRTAGG